MFLPFKKLFVRYKPLFLLIVVASVIWLGELILHSEVEADTFYLPDVSRLEEDQKVVLLWTTFFQRWDAWHWQYPGPVVTGCKDSRTNGKCFVTSDKSQLEKADLVLFSLENIDYGRNFGAKARFPELSWKIRSRQLWAPIWYESSTSVEGNHYSYIGQLEQLDGVFNTTISYRSDSWFKTGMYSGVRYEIADQNIVSSDVFRGIIDKMSRKTK